MHVSSPDLEDEILGLDVGAVVTLRNLGRHDFTELDAFLDYDSKVDYDRVTACSGTFKWPDGRLYLIRVSNPPKKRRTQCNR